MTRDELTQPGQCGDRYPEYAGFDSNDAQGLRKASFDEGLTCEVHCNYTRRATGGVFGGDVKGRISSEPPNRLHQSTSGEYQGPHHPYAISH
jgi:hypothetical protein